MSEDVIDQAAINQLLEVIGGDKEDLIELVEEFQAAAPELVAKMRNAASSGDMDSLRIHAHGLKSNGRDFGALTLAGACEALEHACRDDTVQDPIGKVEEIAQYLVQAQQALSNLASPDE